MSWQKISLTRSQIAFGQLENIFKKCLPIMVASGKLHLPFPLMGNPDENEEHIINVYFSPEIVPFWTEILSEYGAVPCDAPVENKNSN